MKGEEYVVIDEEGGIGGGGVPRDFCARVPGIAIEDIRVLSSPRTDSNSELDWTN